jgi:poly(A) polymerase Pap1
MSKSSAPEMKIELQRPVPSLVEGEDLEHFLENYGCLPADQERATRAQAVKALEAALKDASPSVSEGDARAGPEFVLVPVGSYGLGVWTSSSDIDCLCIGPFSSKTFFKLAIQRLKRAADIKILRRVKANSGYMLELEVHGIKADLQYCAAASIAERYALFTYNLPSLCNKAHC